MEKTPTQELSDILYGLQLQLKMIESITPNDQDYEEKFHRQANLYNDNLKHIKPVFEKILINGYSHFKQDESTISIGSPK